MDIEKVTSSLRLGSQILATQNASQKNKALESVVKSIQANRNKILEANAIDVKIARNGGMSESLVDRLSLDDKKIDGIIQSIQAIIAQADPVGEEIAGWKTPNGLQIRQVRVPVGVIAIIYESRPNVTADAFCLSYKSGNSVLLRGSSSAINSNKAIVDAIKEGLSSPGLENLGVPNAIELAPCKSHDEVQEILSAVGKIDLALPRGGKKLIQMVVESAKVPVIETGSGVCHLYIEEDADLEMACTIAENAKIQRPGVCNAIECIVVNKNVVESFLPRLSEKFNGRVKFHADESSYKILSEAESKAGRKDNVVQATDEDFGNEYLDFECCIKTVNDLAEAIEYINSHNTKHSESIITNNRTKARIFQSQIDASCVYVNASTRFTDGGEFGFGAELGISTQKLHARGPMGIKALTTTKYLIDGDGQVR